MVFKKDYDNHTARHEFGHLVDYNNNWLSSNKMFIKAIDMDKSEILNNKNKYRTLLKNNTTLRGISDIIGGMTDNEIVGLYKHSKKYWSKPNKLERETFAQMFASAGGNDLQQLLIMQQYLPYTFKAFDDIMRRF